LRHSHWILRFAQNDKAFCLPIAASAFASPFPVPPAVTRIFSDLHFGDRASRARRLAQLRPLLDGVDALVLNGDTLDTRPGPRSISPPPSAPR